MLTLWRYSTEAIRRLLRESRPQSTGALCGISRWEDKEERRRVIKRLRTRRILGVRTRGDAVDGHHCGVQHRGTRAG